MPTNISTILTTSSPIGYTGSTGSGYTGSASTTPGYSGSIGYTGSAGTDGVVGYNGSTGYTGSGGTGYTGSGGTIGYTGSIGTAGNTEIAFAIPGTLTVGTGAMRGSFDSTKTLGNGSATVSSAPTTQSIIFDVNKNGTTIFSTQGNRPTITSTNFTDLTSTPDVTSVTSGDYLTVDIDQVGYAGSTANPGTDAVVRIKIT